MQSSATHEIVAGRVEGQKVYCACGRNVGKVDAKGVEFYCRHCHVNVRVDLQLSKLEKLARLAELIASL
ncbi:MAG TPA: hypothetical protein VKT32_07510 [Chthonomonadaceae bacterium]|nr:hypothetical protein [Chthonomonadaceae bacterium]